MRWISLLCCLLTASVASAKDLRIAVVDMQKLFNSYPGTQSAKDKLKDLEQKKMSDLQDTAQEVKDLKSDLSDSTVLSEKERARKEKELQEKEATLEQAQNDAQKELMNQESEMTQDIVDKIKAIVAGVAKDKGIDLVLDQDKTVYAKDAVDLTDDVLKTFGAASSDGDSK